MYPFFPPTFSSHPASSGGQDKAFSTGHPITAAGGNDAQAALMARRLWMASADGSGEQELTADSAYRDVHPLWSGDGDHLLFVRVDARDLATLWLVQLGADSPVRVVDELTQGSGGPKYFDDWQTTVVPYYGHMDWSVLLDWWRGSVASN